MLTATSGDRAADDGDARTGLRGVLSAPDLSLGVRLGTVALLAAVALSRSPHIFRKGRFWAEEGVVYFAHMYEQPGLDGLWFAQVRAGYTNVIANIATWLAALVPLRHAPRVSVWVSFAVLLTLVWVVLSWPSQLLTNAASRLAAALLVVVGTFALPEIWVNSINAEVYLGLLVVVLLVASLEDVSRRRFVVGAGLLALAGLSGIYASVLAPVYLVAAWRERSRRRLVYAGVLCATAAIQLTIYAVARSAGRAGSNRSLVPEPGNAYDGLVGFQLAASVTPASWLGQLQRPAEAGGNGTIVALVALAFAAVVVVALLALRRRVAVLMAACFVIIELVVQAGAIGGVAAGRYAALPMAILALILIGAAAASVHRWSRWLTAVTAGLVVVVGLTQFWTNLPRALRCEGCPSWSGEVARWESGEDTTMEIWPYDRKLPWVIELTREVSAAAEPPP